MDKLNHYMQMALEQAQIAKSMDEVPVGCVIVAGDEIIATAHNTVQAENNSLNHAEVIAINSAMEKLGDKRLENCDLYVTMEPCLMCGGAINNARIAKVVFGCYDPNNGCIEHNQKIFENNRTNHSPEIIGGIMEDECGQLVKDFFADKR